MMKHRNAGFTLLEMAIVLMIVVILAMFILGGREMLEQSTKRAVVTEIGKYVRGIQIFNDHYGQLPGDFNNAEATWGSDAGCPNTAFSVTPRAATCNGDGNGTIGSFDGASFSNTTEWYRAWQQLADAGIIDGQYVGVVGSVPGQVLGLSIPKSAFPNGGYTLLYRFNSALSAEDFAFTGHNLIEFGAVDAACAGGVSCITHGALLTPVEALELDEKMDDGRPGTGSVTSRPSTSALNPACTTSTDFNAAQYNTANAAVACALIINTNH